jgi:hypothetical protein
MVRKWLKIQALPRKADILAPPLDHEPGRHAINRIIT